MSYICYNGKMFPAGEPVILASNRGYRYGDGLFETIKLQQGRICFATGHFDRLFHGLALLQYDLPALFSREKLEEAVLRLCAKNNCMELARVRLSVSRGMGGLYDTDRKLNWLVESWPLNPTVNTINENGLVIGIYPESRKSTDAFSNLKSANFLCYTLAAQYAIRQKWNDALVLNTSGTIADSTIANLFIVKGNTIITPALSEGCVDGVFRKQLLHWLRQHDYMVEETILSSHEMQMADEIFLTNAIHGIRWVARCGEQAYQNTITREIYNGFRQTIAH